MFILVYYLELIIIGRFVYCLVALFLLYIYLYLFPFSLFVSVYVYASLCDFVCVGLLLPFVLGFCPFF